MAHTLRRTPDDKTLRPLKKMYRRISRQQLRKEYGI